MSSEATELLLRLRNPLVPFSLSVIGPKGLSKGKLSIDKVIDENVVITSEELSEQFTSRNRYPKHSEEKYQFVMDHCASEWKESEIQWKKWFQAIKECSWARMNNRDRLPTYGLLFSYAQSVPNARIDQHKLNGQKHISFRNNIDFTQFKQLSGDKLELKLAIIFQQEWLDFLNHHHAMYNENMRAAYERQCFGDLNQLEHHFFAPTLGLFDPHGFVEKQYSLALKKTASLFHQLLCTHGILDQFYKTISYQLVKGVSKYLDKVRGMMGSIQAIAEEEAMKLPVGFRASQIFSAELHPTTPLEWGLATLKKEDPIFQYAAQLRECIKDAHVAYITEEELIQISMRLGDLLEQFARRRAKLLRECFISSEPMDTIVLQHFDSILKSRWNQLHAVMTRQLAQRMGETMFKMYKQHINNVRHIITSLSLEINQYAGSRDALCILLEEGKMELLQIDESMQNLMDLVDRHEQSIFREHQDELDENNMITLHFSDDDDMGAEAEYKYANKELSAKHEPFLLMDYLCEAERVSAQIRFFEHLTRETKAMLYTDAPSARNAGLLELRERLPEMDKESTLISGMFYEHVKGLKKEFSELQKNLLKEEIKTNLLHGKIEEEWIKIKDMVEKALDFFYCEQNQFEPLKNKLSANLRMNTKFKMSGLISLTITEKSLQRISIIEDALARLFNAKKRNLVHTGSLYLNWFDSVSEYLRKSTEKFMQNEST